MTAKKTRKWIDIGDTGAARGAFHWTTHFFEDPQLIERLVEAYDRAAGEAACLARIAVRGAKPAVRERALWAEAVAETLEAVLEAIPHACEVRQEDGEVAAEEIDGSFIVLPRAPSET